MPSLDTKKNKIARFQIIAITLNVKIATINQG